LNDRLVGNFLVPFWPNLADRAEKEPTSAAEDFPTTVPPGIDVRVVRSLRYSYGQERLEVAQIGSALVALASELDASVNCLVAKWRPVPARKHELRSRKS
jgi:hypothetical protein